MSRTCSWNWSPGRRFHTPGPSLTQHLFKHHTNDPCHKTQNKGWSHQQQLHSVHCTPTSSSPPTCSTGQEGSAPLDHTRGWTCPRCPASVTTMTKTFLPRRSSNLHRLLSALKTSCGTIDRFFNLTDAIILIVFFSSRRCSELPCVQAWWCSYRRKGTWRLFCPLLWCCWCFYPHLDLAAAQVDVVDHHL